jgi:hypothetical protein
VITPLSDRINLRFLWRLPLFLQEVSFRYFVEFLAEFVRRTLRSSFIVLSVHRSFFTGTSCTLRANEPPFHLILITKQLQ